MKRTLHILAIAALLCGLGAAQAFAQPADLIQTRVALHAQAYNAKACGTVQDPVASGTPCSTYNMAWGTFSSASVWMVLGNGGGPGFTGTTLGIDYDPSIGIFAWTRCTTLEFPNTGPNGPWPAAGGGNVMTWENCAGTEIAPDGTHAALGMFYVYAYGPGSFMVTENRNLSGGLSDFNVANCGGQSLSLWNYLNEDVRELVFGVVDFGGGNGYTPCGVVSNQPTTWGNIKNKYNSGE